MRDLLVVAGGNKASGPLSTGAILGLGFMEDFSSQLSDADANKIVKRYFLAVKPV